MGPIMGVFLPEGKFVIYSGVVNCFVSVHNLMFCNDKIDDNRGGSLFQFYRERYNCQVDIYGVWGDEDDDPRLLCDPYVLITSEESKQQVDRCIQFIGYRIKEHEEKYGAHVEHD